MANDEWLREKKGEPACQEREKWWDQVGERKRDERGLGSDLVSIEVSD